MDYVLGWDFASLGLRQVCAKPAVTNNTLESSFRRKGYETQVCGTHPTSDVCESNSVKSEIRLWKNAGV